MDSASAELKAPGNVVRRVLGFMAWFGIIYGLLGTISFASYSFHSNLRFWMTIATSGRVLDMGRLISDMVVRGSSVGLLIASISLIKGWPRARTGLLVWAVLVLSFELIYESSVVQRQFSTPYWNLSGLISSVTYWVKRVYFPIMLLCIVSMREMNRAYNADGTGAFQILPVQGNLEEFDSSQPWTPDIAGEFSSAAIVREIYTCIAWVGTVIAICELCGATSEMGYWIVNPDVSEGSLRLIVAEWLERLMPFNFIMLLCGSVPMLLGRANAVKVVRAWAILFLILALAHLALYDCAYIWWVATKARPEPQSWPELAAIQLFDALQSAAFAIIVWYLLRQPEIGKVEREI